jgi:hypothetical protein
MATPTEHLVFEVSNLCDRDEKLAESTDDTAEALRLDVVARLLEVLREITDRALSLDEGTIEWRAGS